MLQVRVRCVSLKVDYDREGCHVAELVCSSDKVKGGQFLIVGKVVKISIPANALVVGKSYVLTVGEEPTGESQVKRQAGD